jgi:hypothetical protein
MNATHWVRRSSDPAEFNSRHLLVPDFNKTSVGDELGKRCAQLRMLKLTNSEALAALGRVLANWGKVNETRRFREVILGCLALIADSRTNKYKRAVLIGSSTEQAKKKRRLADRLRRLADDLVEPRDPLQLSKRGPIALISEMRSHADILSNDANGRSRFRIASPSGVVSENRRPLARKAARETGEIRKLVEFVQHQTGRKHWSELAILLRLATGDAGYNKHRLQSLCSFYSRKEKAARERFRKFLLDLRRTP